MPPFMFQLHSSAGFWRTAAPPTPTREPVNPPAEPGAAPPIPKPMTAPATPCLSAGGATALSSPPPPPSPRTESQQVKAAEAAEAASDNDSLANTPALSRRQSWMLCDASMASTVILTPAAPSPLPPLEPLQGGDKHPRSQGQECTERERQELAVAAKHAEEPAGAAGAGAGGLVSEPLDINVLGLHLGGADDSRRGNVPADMEEDSSSSSSSENSSWSNSIPSWVLRRELVPACHAVRRDVSATRVGRVVGERERGGVAADEWNDNPENRGRGRLEERFR